MIILITGCTHTGKTVLAQKLLEKYHFPYMSIDHLKMGLIRSGQTKLTPEHDDELTEYLWPIVREMIKTAIENNQNLIVEGCYVPFDWQKDFTPEYRHAIEYYCLIMTRSYIEQHFDAIRAHASDVEQRLDDDAYLAQDMISENEKNLQECRQHGQRYILIDQEYNVDIDLPGLTAR